ncbi:MAG: DUF4258 domain-containing protein [candidate division Zixibacteria bacterium]|nr:DUF4258 domain-containing protein [Candidatus Tariuqbacter arcticus]
MKRIRWLQHAEESLSDREIKREEVEIALRSPDLVEQSWGNRSILMRKYYDSILQQAMLLRVVVEESIEELVVVTVYKTSQINRYTRRS